jgi:hypothetical protein
MIVIENPCLDSGLGGTCAVELLKDEVVRDDVPDGRVISLFRPPADSFVEL